jgi:hypothetical protein
MDSEKVREIFCNGEHKTNNEPKQVCRHWQQDDARSSDTDANADKIGGASAEAPTKWHPKHSRDGANESIDNLTDIGTAQGRWRNRSELNFCCTHLTNNQIMVGYAYMSSIDEADVVQTHHAILKNEAGCRKFKELPEIKRFTMPSSQKMIIERGQLKYLFFARAWAPLITAVTVFEGVMGSVSVSPSGSGTCNHNG